nr:mesoderm induction early response protein 2 [Saimiri boliviensis boliviensis]
MAEVSERAGGAGPPPPRARVPRRPGRASPWAPAVDSTALELRGRPGRLARPGPEGRGAPSAAAPGPARPPLPAATSRAAVSSLGRQSPRVVSCLAHSLYPEEPGLQKTAVVSIGSGDHQFNLAEILSQNYSVEGELEEASRCSDKPKEELEKDFIFQSSDMPFDELLALYGYEASDPISEQESEGGDMAPNLPDMTLDMEQIAKDLLSGEEEEETQPSANDLTPTVTSHEASDLFPNRSGLSGQGGRHSLGIRWMESGSKVSLPGERAVQAASSGDPGGPASIFPKFVSWLIKSKSLALPANKCKKEIMVGPQFQADLSSLHLNWPCEKNGVSPCWPGSSPTIDHP